MCQPALFEPLQNCLVLVHAISDVDKALGVIPWTNVISVMQRPDLEADLATFTMTLVNKTLFGVPDQDTFYDQGGDSIMRPHRVAI